MISITDIVCKLKNIIEGKSSREEVAEWAFRYYTDDNLEFDDDVKDLLYQTMLIDSAFGRQGNYIYPIAQIEEWIQGHSE